MKATFNKDQLEVLKQDKEKALYGFAYRSHTHKMEGGGPVPRKTAGDCMYFTILVTRGTKPDEAFAKAYGNGRRFRGKWNQHKDRLLMAKETV